MGLATEAVQGLRRVTAEAFVPNDASWRLMEQVRMRRETYAVGLYLHRDLGGRIAWDTRS